MQYVMTPVRSFAGALAVLLTMLLALGTTTDQVASAAEARAVAVQENVGSSNGEQHTAPSECHSRRGARGASVPPPPTAGPLFVCGCYSCPPDGAPDTASVTQSNSVARGRSVDIQVMHQVFRC